MVVAVSDALVDEDAVVVQPADAALADVAMLGARGLEKPACAALLAGLVDGEVIRVEVHVVGVVVVCDVPRVAGCGQVEENVGQHYRN